jgi:subtilisin family serine protease
MKSALLVLAGFILSSALSLAAAESKLDPRVFAGRETGETASFLVVMREQADLSGAETFSDRVEKGRFVFEALAAQAEATQGPLRAWLDAAGIPYRPFYLVNMIEVEAAKPLAEELAAREDVSSIAPNPQVPIEPQPAIEQESGASPHASRLTPSATQAVEPNIAKIRAPEVWSQGFTGQGIVVGMADTGVVFDHQALKAHYRGTNGALVFHDYNWHDAIHDPLAGNPCGADSPTPCDDDVQHHGTATASLVVGDDGVGNQVGVAPGARFIACRNMDRGTGTPARYTECFQFFLAPTDRNGANPRPELAANVINNSWGCPQSEGCTDPNVLKAVVENVRAGGILVVVAAGNSGPACGTISDVPAFYDASFSIGATTTLTDTSAGFSSRGPITADGSNRLKPDISAPGVGLRVAAPPNIYRTNFSGTSGSAPHVTGAAALLLSAVPQLIGQPVAAADVLRRSAVPLTSAQDCGGFPGAAVPNAVFGSGRVDVAAAVLLASPVARPKPSLSPRRGGAKRLAPRA